MDLYYGRTVASVGTIEQADNGWLEADEPVTARVQPRPAAMGGEDKQAAIGPISCLVRHDGACTLTLTPIIDGEVLDDLAATYELAKPVTGRVKDDVVRLYLSKPVDWPDGTSGFSRQALRGTFATVRAELAVVNTPEVRAGVDDEGFVYALGGFVIEARPVGISGVSIPA